MGSVIGKQGVAEPSFQILLERSNPTTAAYEIRKYGHRFAAEVSYKGGDKDLGSPFGTLARYIGVFGSAENEGSQSIDMTAPVIMKDNDTTKSSGTKIAMTAPVVTADGADGKGKIMKFMLPSEYDDLSKIPKPTNPHVRIEQLPPVVGAVHRYNGNRDPVHNQKMAKGLANALLNDGVEGISEEYVMNNFEYWGYDPPFTIPYFRRNEVWMELSQKQVDQLIKKNDPSLLN